MGLEFDNLNLKIKECACLIPCQPPRRMARSASLAIGYLYVKPSSWALAGSTFCPSSTCNQLKLFDSNQNKARGWNLEAILTTEAPSPRTALSASSGTGSHEGRPMTCPKCSHISARQIGFGAVPLMTPTLHLDRVPYLSCICIRQHRFQTMSVSVRPGPAIYQNYMHTQI